MSNKFPKPFASLAKARSAKPVSQPERSYYDIIGQKVFETLLHQEDADDDTVRRIIGRVANEIIQENNPDFQYRQDLQERLFNRFRRLDILQPLLDDSEITEIMVNGPEQIFFEKQGRLIRSPQRFPSAEYLTDVISGFFSRNNQPLSLSRPLGSIRLPDGSRAHAVLPPIAQDGPLLTIRKFSGIRPGLAELIENNFFPEEIAGILIEAVRQRKAIMIGGGTGSGKTTLLNILSGYISPDERIITIEDSPELQLQNRSNWVRLTGRAQGPEGTEAIDSATLIRNSLRMRPDRIIVGEVRGDEAYDMMQAAATGHPGTLCTIHGNNCESMFLRLADLVLAASKLNYDVILRHLASAFQLLVYIARDLTGQRYVEEIAELKPDVENHYQLNYLYRRST